MKRIYKVTFVVRSTREYGLETKHVDKHIAAENIPALLSPEATREILHTFLLDRRPFGCNDARGEEVFFLSIAEQAPILVIV